jgi:putative glycosyltransferase (TIGR04348 family)
MKIIIATPAPRGSRKGNRITADRWARILRRLGHRVEICVTWTGGPCDVLVALHARRSLSSIEPFLERRQGKLVLALTGTDIYGDLKKHDGARRAVERADRLITLQPLSSQEIPDTLRAKVRVIYQSAAESQARVATSQRFFEVAFVAHLRDVKDPFRAATAARRLDATSRLRILHAGKALDDAMDEQARREDAENPRYTWLGELPPWRVRQLLKRCRAMVLTSQLEGGANVIGEAVVAGCPVVASRIPGSVGLLGEDYPGYFEFGDTEGLASLFRRIETEPDFLSGLIEHCQAVAPLFDPERESEAWRQLVDELGLSS